MTYIQWADESRRPHGQKNTLPGKAPKATSGEWQPPSACQNVPRTAPLRRERHVIEMENKVHRNVTFWRYGIHFLSANHTDMTTLRLSFFLGLSALLASCATEKTTFNDGSRIEWEAKRSAERTQELAEQTGTATAAHQTAADVRSEISPEAPASFEQPVAVSPALPEADVSARAPSDIAPLDNKSVVERLSFDHSTSAPAPGNEKEDANDKTNGMAIAGFVTSFFFPVVGIVLSAIALGQIKRNGGRGRGLATAGLIIGIVTTLLIIALI